jgi:hypothetical protein
LCSSAESKLRIVVQSEIRKTFLVHKSGASKAAKNQSAIALRNKSPPSFHRKSTALSTVGTIHAVRGCDIRALMHFCATGVYDDGLRMEV